MKRYCYICKETIDNDKITVCPVCGCENSLCASKDEEELLRIGYKTTDLERMKQLKEESPDTYSKQIQTQKDKTKKIELEKMKKYWKIEQEFEGYRKEREAREEYYRKNGITPPQPKEPEPQPTTPQKYVVHCPYCQSPNVHKIGFGERATSVFMLGPFSKKINKSYQCKNCRATW